MIYNQLPYPTQRTEQPDVLLVSPYSPLNESVASSGSKKKIRIDVRAVLDKVKNTTLKSNLSGTSPEKEVV